MSSAEPRNSILSFIYQLIPVPFIYMALAAPLALFYLFWWYLPEILDQRRENKLRKEELKKSKTSNPSKTREEELNEIIDRYV
jgi:hypothetical protein